MPTFRGENNKIINIGGEVAGHGPCAPKESLGELKVGGGGGELRLWVD